MTINLGYNYTETEGEEGLKEVVRHNQVLDVVGWPRGHKPVLIILNPRERGSGRGCTPQSGSGCCRLAVWP